MSTDEIFEFGHKLGDFCICRHAADAVITAGNKAHQFAVWRAILGYGHGRMARFLLERQNICKRIIRTKVGIAGNKAGFIALDPGDHCGLALDGLRTINKRKTAFLRQSNGHPIVGYRLHNSGNQRYVERELWLFAFFEFTERRF